MDDLIGIVTPAYNVQRYLPATAQSLLAQTHRHWHWVIADDGSKDDTLAVARALAARDVRISVIAKPNSGVAETRNAALAALPTAVRYVAFNDADDLYEPDALASLLQALHACPDCAGVHALAEYIDSDGRPLRPGEFARYGRERLTVAGSRVVPLGPGQPTTLAALLMKSFHPPGVFLVRRDIAEKVGGFDKATSPAEDWDYWLRAARHGNFAFLDQVVLRYRRHETNASGNYDLMYLKGHYIRHKTFYSPENTHEQQDLLRRAFRAFQKWKMRQKAADAAGALRRGRVAQAAKMTAHIAAHGLLYLRGTPSATGR